MQDTIQIIQLCCNLARPLSLNNLVSTGHLPSPENVHINVNSSTIEWKPPYSSLNSDIIQVDPHITQYTIYITDLYTGSTFKRNVAETQFTFNTSDNDSCPTYQVSAWNSGSEGELSAPVPDSTPQGKKVKNVLGLLTSFYCCSLSLSLSQFLKGLPLRMSLLHTQ